MWIRRHQRHRCGSCCQDCPSFRRRYHVKLWKRNRKRLAEVKGISEKKAREIAAQTAEKADMRKAMMFLQKYGISLNLGAKIYQKYGDSVYNVLQENPYRLADDISGVGFKIADEIAGRIGIHTDSDYRIRSGMMYIFYRHQERGMCIFLRKNCLDVHRCFWV